MKKHYTLLQKAWPWAAAALLAFYLYRTVDPAIDLSTPHGPAPDFALETMTGETFRLSDQRGKIVVLNFWATWCPPCRMEIPGFVELQQTYRDDVVFVGAVLDEDPSAGVQAYAERAGINYPLLPDGHRAARVYGGITTLPTTYLIDRQGTIRYVHRGLLLSGGLRAAIELLRDED